MQNLMLSALLLTMAMHCAAQDAPALKPWSAAKYHGLIVGTSTRSDVLKLLGKPNYVGKEEDTGTPIMTYAVIDPLPGTLVVYVTKGILDEMRLDLKKSLTQHDIVRLFGSGFVIVHYATDECIDTGGHRRSTRTQAARSSIWSTAIAVSQQVSLMTMTRR